MKYCLVGFVFGLAVAMSAAAATPPAVNSNPDSETLSEEFGRGFYSRVNILGFGIHNKLRESPINPNNVLNIPRNQAELDFRPDFNLTFRRVELSVKPRAQAAWSEFENGARGDSSDRSTRTFINEWFLRYRIANPLFASYGRENLQWGPSSLLSPSNPFNPDNGRNNPRLEVEGLDYARLIWIPSSAWTLSLIANTGKGSSQQNDVFLRQNLPFLQRDNSFKKSQAIKLDYTGEGRYFSLIASRHEREEPQLGFFEGLNIPEAAGMSATRCTSPNTSDCNEKKYRLGFFGGRNVSDALLLYTEGSGSNKSDTANNRSDFELLVGGSYTLQSGKTFTLEYFHNNNGCDRTRIDLCFFAGEIDPRDILFRRRYLMFQYGDTGIWDKLNLNIRLIRNIDDSSNRAIAVFEYEVGKHTQLYFIPNVFSGDQTSEFGSLLRYSLFVGAGYTF